MPRPPIFEKFGPNFTAPPPGFQMEYGGDIVSTNILTIGSMIDADGYPILSETFEWIALLSAINDARDRFTMIELGAGVGRWSAAAACVARKFRPDLKVRLIAIEAEPTHFKWMCRNFSDNGVDQNQHRLVFGAVGSKDGAARFVSGEARAWYGQALEFCFHGAGWISLSRLPER